jgi:hypothetical protein
MKILFRVLMGIAAICGSHASFASEATQANEDQVDLEETLALANGTVAFTADTTLADGVLTNSSSLLANDTATNDDTFADANSHLEIDIISNNTLGFSLSMTSENDGNFMSDQQESDYCDDATGAATNDLVDGRCISYMIECNDILHRKITDEAGITTPFNEEGQNGSTAGEWVQLQDEALILWETSDAKFEGVVQYSVASGTPIYCELKFAPGETTEELSADGTDTTYEDTITLTYTVHGE